MGHIQQKRNTKANIARRFFQVEEAEHIEKQSGEQQTDLFFRYWKGKESYLKLKGEGIAGGMDSFFVDLEEKRIRDPYNDNQEIYLKEYKCLEDYYIHMCLCTKQVLENSPKRSRSGFFFWMRDIE